MDAQVACELEDEELKRKAAIKEKARATSKTVENQSEPTSQEASEPKHKDEDLLLDGDSSRSTQLDDDVMTIGGYGNEGLDLTSEQKSLCKFYNGDQVDEQTEHQVPRVSCV